MTNQEIIAGLQKALTYAGDTHTLADVAEAVERGDAQLWVEEDAVVVSEIRVAPQKKTIRIWLAAGAMDSVIDLTHRVGEWGREQGCAAITFVGRRGWERVAKQHDGWEHRLSVLTKDLS